jgi:hypothetical protein
MEIHPIIFYLLAMFLVQCWRRCPQDASKVAAKRTETNKCMTKDAPSAESRAKLLLINKFPQAELDQMAPAWRSLKAEELLLESDLRSGQLPDAWLDRAEKWAASYGDSKDPKLTPIPVELPSRLYNDLVKGTLNCDREALLRFSHLLQSIFERFSPGDLTQALSREPQLKKATHAPLELYLDSDRRVISANVWLLSQRGGAMPAFEDIPLPLQNAVTQCAQERAYVTFRRIEEDGWPRDVMIAPWQGNLEGVVLLLGNPPQLRQADFRPALQWLHSYSERLSEAILLWHRHRDPAQIKPEIEKLWSLLRSEYFELINQLIHTLPNLEWELRYHGSHALARGIREGLLWIVVSAELRLKPLAEPEHVQRLHTMAPQKFWEARMVIEMTIAFLECLACESAMETSSFASEEVVTAAFDKFRSAGLIGRDNCNLESQPSSAGNLTLTGDRKMIEQACFGILYELTYHKVSFSVTVGYHRETVDGTAGVRIDFEEKSGWGHGLHALGFTGLEVAARAVRVSGGRLLIPASRKEGDPRFGRISIWIPDSPPAPPKCVDLAKARRRGELPK